MSSSSKIKRWIIHIFMALYMAAILFPLLWMAVSGFKTDSDIFGSPWNLPETWQVSNYFYVWRSYIQNTVINSLFFTVAGTFFVILISGMAAYGIIRFEFKHRYLAFMFILSGMMLAPQCSLIPIYKLLSLVGLYNTRIGLLVPYIAYRIPFSFFLMWSFKIGRASCRERVC